MEDVEEPPVLTTYSFVCGVEVVENEGDYIFDDNILKNLTYICFYILSSRTKQNMPRQY